MRTLGTLIWIGLLATACTNLEDASPAKKNTFLKFYHNSNNYSAVDVLPNNDGYTLFANLEIRNDSSVAVLVNTDAYGEPLAEPVLYPTLEAKSVVENLAGTGYILVGDSINISPDAERVADIEVSSARIVEVSSTGSVIREYTLRDTITVNRNRAYYDFKTNAVTKTSNGYLVLGTFREDLIRPEKSFVLTLSATLVPLEFRTFILQDAGIDYNYLNSKSIILSGNHYLWGTSLTKSTGDFNESFVGIPYVRVDSDFDNFSQLGETSAQQFLVRQVVPSLTEGAGYGLVGTRAETSFEVGGIPTDANIFFLRIDANGNIIKNSDRYYDFNLTSSSLEPVDADESVSFDFGETITSLSAGGYVIAGATQEENENSDAFVIKLDLAGFPVWVKSFGGDGKESIKSIHEDSDGNFIAVGTSNIGNLSSLFLLKLNADGNLTD